MDAPPPTDLPAPIRAALEAPTDGSRRTIHAAGIAFSAIAWDGDGPPLLLLHGVTSSADTWWRIGPALAATGRSVLAPDLPGHGQTGQWRGHHRFRDNARDLVAFARAAGLDRDGLAVVGHSWGAMTAAAFPAAGLRPGRLVLVDPPSVAHAVIAQMAADPDERTYAEIDRAVAAVRRENPEWHDRDVLAKAIALTQLDEAAARSVLLDNGDWDGGLADLADPAAANVPIFVIRGDPAHGGLMPDPVLPALIARVGGDRVWTIPGGAHSPPRLHPHETMAALLAALDAPVPTPGA